MFAKPHMGRTTADADGDVVVVFIGMRINHMWAVHRWVPVMWAMFYMLKELGRDRGLGLRHHILGTSDPRNFHVVQYWESKEKLLAYAAAPSKRHQPWWARVNRYARISKGHVGIWHETYIAPEGSYETIYGDMPAYGLAKAYGVKTLGDGVQARDRLKA